MADDLRTTALNVTRAAPPQGGPAPAMADDLRTTLNATRAAVARQRERETGRPVGDPMTAEDARRLTDRIKFDAGQLWDRVVEAYLGRADIALRYESWDAYCIAEFGALRLRIPREERTDLVNSLRHAGLSNRAIGSAIGVSEGTVRNDLAAQNYAPDELTEQALIAGEQTDDDRPTAQDYAAFNPTTAREPTRFRPTGGGVTREPVRRPTVVITGRDGKKYPAKPDVPQPLTPSEKVQREARKIAADMDALATRLLQLWMSDRALDKSQLGDFLQTAWTDLEDAWNLRWR